MFVSFYISLAISLSLPLSYATVEIIKYACICHETELVRAVWCSRRDLAQKGGLVSEEGMVYRVITCM